MRCLAWIACGLCLAGAAARAWALDEVVLANGEWAPYQSAKLPHQGFASHVVSEAFRLAGIQVIYRFYPWARAEAMVRGGGVAGSLVWSETPQRRAFAWFSDPVIVDDEVVFHLATRKMKTERIEDFYGLTMATFNGSRLGAWQEAIDAGRIRSYVVKDIEAGMRQLLIGRLDFIPLIRSVGFSVLRQHFTPREQAAIVAEPHVFVRAEYGVMFSRKQPGGEALLRRFNAGLAKLKASAEYRQMARDFAAGKYDPQPY